MSKCDEIAMRFPSLRFAVEDWLWLDRAIPTNQSEIAEMEQIVNSILHRMGLDPAAMSESQKAQFLFQEIGEPHGFSSWSEP